METFSISDTTPGVPASLPNPETYKYKSLPDYRPQSVYIACVARREHPVLFVPVITEWFLFMSLPYSQLRWYSLLALCPRCCLVTDPSPFICRSEAERWRVSASRSLQVSRVDSGRRRHGRRGHSENNKDVSFHSEEDLGSV